MLRNTDILDKFSHFSTSNFHVENSTWTQLNILLWVQMKCIEYIFQYLPRTMWWHCPFMLGSRVCIFSQPVCMPLFPNCDLPGTLKWCIDIQKVKLQFWFKLQPLVCTLSLFIFTYEVGDNELHWFYAVSLCCKVISWPESWNLFQWILPVPNCQVLSDIYPLKLICKIKNQKWNNNIVWYIFK